MRCAFGAHLFRTLASQSDHTHADWLELCMFSSLVSGKMAVFDKTESQAHHNVPRWSQLTLPSHSSIITALRWVMLNTRQRAEEFGVGGTMMSLPTTTKWQQRAPSWSTTLGLRHVSYTEERRSSRRARVQEELNMIHYPRAAACLFTRLRAEESKVGGNMTSLPTTTKWQQEVPSWSTTLGLRHVYTKKQKSSRRAQHAPLP